MEIPIAIFSISIFFIYGIFSFKYKKKHSIEGSVNPWKLLSFPAVLIVILTLTSIFYVIPMFPYSHESINGKIDAFQLIIMILYFIIVDLLVIKGKAVWFLKKKKKN